MLGCFKGRKSIKQKLLPNRENHITISINTKAIVSKKVAKGIHFSFWDRPKSLYLNQYWSLKDNCLETFLTLITGTQWINLGKIKIFYVSICRTNLLLINSVIMKGNIMNNVLILCWHPVVKPVQKGNEKNTVHAIHSAYWLGEGYNGKKAQCLDFSNSFTVKLQSM